MPAARASVSTLLSAWQSRSKSSTRLADESALATRANSSESEDLTCRGTTASGESACFPFIAGELYEPDDFESSAISPGGFHGGPSGSYSSSPFGSRPVRDDQRGWP